LPAKKGKAAGEPRQSIGRWKGEIVGGEEERRLLLMGGRMCACRVRGEEKENDPQWRERKHQYPQKKKGERAVPIVSERKRKKRGRNRQR